MTFVRHLFTSKCNFILDKAQNLIKNIRMWKSSHILKPCNIIFLLLYNCEYLVFSNIQSPVWTCSIWVLRHSVISASLKWFHRNLKPYFLKIVWEPRIWKYSKVIYEKWYTIKNKNYCNNKCQFNNTCCPLKRQTYLKKPTGLRFAEVCMTFKWAPGVKVF